MQTSVKHAAPAAADQLFDARNGGSWTVAGHRVRWTHGRDGCSVRAHSPAAEHTGAKLNGRNVVKVSLRSPISGGTTLTRAVVNIALSFALAKPHDRTVKLEETDQGMFALTLSTLTHQPILLAGSDAAGVRRALARLATLEEALERRGNGTHTRDDVALLSSYYSQVSAPVS